MYNNEVSSNGDVVFNPFALIQKSLAEDRNLCEHSR